MDVLDVNCMPAFNFPCAHCLETQDGSQQEAFLRCTLERDTENYIAYHPHAVPDSQIASGQLKRAVLGAAFSGCFEKIYESPYLEVIWECGLQKTPPAMMKPLKPKCYLACHTSLEANKYYKLF